MGLGKFWPEQQRAALAGGKMTEMKLVKPLRPHPKVFRTALLDVLDLDDSSLSNDELQSLVVAKHGEFTTIKRRGNYYLELEKEGELLLSVALRRG
jgi:hypothetical protein